MAKGVGGAATVEVKALQKSYRSVKALDRVTLRVGPGEVMALLGPNGAGKTTFVRILSTLLKPDEGDVEVAGIDVLRNPRAARCRIAVCGQQVSLDDRLTGAANLLMLANLNHLPRARRSDRVDALIEHFALGEVAGRSTRTYSGGQRRRLDVAAAMIADPAVLLLDEPTTGLDLHSRLALWASIEKLAASGTTILLTTQYLEEADRLADRIGVFNRGRLVAVGSPQELKSTIGGMSIEVVTTSNEAAEQVADALRWARPEGLSVDGTCVRLIATEGLQTLKMVTDGLGATERLVSAVHLQQPSIDDVFISLIEAESSSDARSVSA